MPASFKGSDKNTDKLKKSESYNILEHCCSDRSSLSPSTETEDWSTSSAEIQDPPLATTPPEKRNEDRAVEASEPKKVELVYQKMTE